MKSISKKVRQSAQDQVVQKLLETQWLISWGRCRPQIGRALKRLTRYLNAELVLYAIELVQKLVTSDRLALEIIDQLAIRWHHTGITTVQAAQKLVRNQRLHDRPWNLETKQRILNSHPSNRLVNNVSRRSKLPKAFRTKRKR